MSTQEQNTPTLSDNPVDKIWKQIEDMKNTTVKAKGGVFSRKKSLPPSEYYVLDVRVGHAVVVNLKNGDIEHPTYELLLFNDGMKRSQWSRPFPIREIKLVNDKWVAL